MNGHNNEASSPGFLTRGPFRDFVVRLHLIKVVDDDDNNDAAAAVVIVDVEALNGPSD